ncbi:P-loop containing nucleoside triphosphate hydrolase protein [Panus rudis PR-1116 ss-1]|nr:P-loop containing nucleoside triphosphate hydrolase protein [Panus rudis PR-1116 ss-1]
MLAVLSSPRGIRAIAYSVAGNGSTTTYRAYPSLPLPLSRSYATKTETEPILTIPGSSIYPLGASQSQLPLFHNVKWTIHPTEAWTVLSEGSTSFKTSLLQALTGHLRISPFPPPPGGLFPFLRGRDPHKCVELVSFAHRSSAAGSGFVDFTARYGAVREEDKRTLRETFFPETAKPIHNLAVPTILHANSTQVEVGAERARKRRVLFEEMVDTLDLRRFLELPMVALSNGQTRKARILKALLDLPELILLDEPLTGLDVTTRQLVLSLLETIHKSPDRPYVIIGARIQDPLPNWTTHLAVINRDGTVSTGRKEDLLHLVEPHQKHAQAHRTRVTPPVAHRDTREVLIDMNDVNVTYGDRRVHIRSSLLSLRTEILNTLQVLKNIHWKIHANSRWHLLGSNGAGKTTLLSLLTGDHPQSYTQSKNLTLFSKPRNQWATPYLQSRIGRVSPELANAFPRRRGGMSVWEAVGTGFPGGGGGGFVPRGRRRVGLADDGRELEEGGEEERWRVERVWHVLQGLGPTAWSTSTSESKSSPRTMSEKDRATLESFANKQFADLSPGEQSIVLLMRALVSHPPIVLLDEAWSGMDEAMVRAARKYLRTPGRDIRNQDEEAGGGGLVDGQACIVVTHWEEEVPWGWEDGVRRFELADGVGREVPNPLAKH